MKRYDNEVGLVMGLQHRHIMPVAHYYNGDTESIRRVVSRLPHPGLSSNYWLAPGQLAARSPFLVYQLMSGTLLDWMQADFAVAGRRACAETGGSPNPDTPPPSSARPPKGRF